MDFVAARLLDGRWLWVLRVIDQFTRECLLLADTSLTGQNSYIESFTDGCAISA